MTSKLRSVQCPICQGQFDAVDRAWQVCALHDNWLVTTCDYCGRRVFSYAVGMCPPCSKRGKNCDAHSVKGHQDRRRPLVEYGLETADT